jgi:hypothetical protein
MEIEDAAHLNELIDLDSSIGIILESQYDFRQKLLIPITPRYQLFNELKEFYGPWKVSIQIDKEFWVDFKAALERYQERINKRINLLEQ